MLGRLASGLSSLLPARLCANASRCPGMVEAEVRRAARRGCEVLFEPRPLGVVGTLARLGESRPEGAWLVSNTDMVCDADWAAMLSAHMSSGSDWTAVVGDPPGEGGYGTVPVADGGSFGVPGGKPMHYWGISIVSPRLLSIARGLRCGTFFGELAGAALSAGLRLRAWTESGPWLDTGTAESYRRALLATGSYISPTARIDDGAVLSGSWFVDGSCVVASGAVLSDSVMLEGSRLGGGVLAGQVLPWLCEWGSDD